MPRVLSDKVKLVAASVRCVDDVALIICGYSIHFPWHEWPAAETLTRLWYDWSWGLLIGQPVTLRKQLEVEFVAAIASPRNAYDVVYVDATVTRIDEMTGDLELTTVEPVRIRCHARKLHMRRFETVLPGVAIQFAIINDGYSPWWEASAPERNEDRGLPHRWPAQKKQSVHLSRVSESLLIHQFWLSE